MNLGKFFGFGKIKEEEKLDFVKNLNILIDSGITINQGFEIIIEQVKKGPYRKFLIQAKKKIEQGGSFYSVLEDNGDFDKIFVRFIKAGEDSGTLGQNLKFLADWLERRIALKKNIKGATLYPKIIIIFAFLLGSGLSIFILPQIVTVLDGLDIELPLTTKIVLYFSHIMQDHGLYFFFGIIALFIALKLLIKINLIKKGLDIVLLKTPIIGLLIKEYQLALISQLNFTLLRAGITVNQTLEVTAESLSNSCYRRTLLKAKKRVETGTNLSSALREYPSLYPSIFIRVMSVGETTGTLEKSFSYLTDFFFDKVFNKIKNLPVIIEPILLIVIGLFIAVFATAIILPIYKVTTGI